MRVTTKSYTACEQTARPGRCEALRLPCGAQDLRPTGWDLEFEGLGIVEFAEAGLSAEGTSPRRSFRCKRAVH